MWSDPANGTPGRRESHRNPPPRGKAGPRNCETCRVRLIVARCPVDYSGRLNTHLPLATRLIIIKADGTVAFHRDIQHAPLNWMSPRYKTRLSMD